MITEAQYLRQPDVARKIIDVQHQIDAILAPKVMPFAAAVEVRRLVKLRQGYVEDAAHIYGTKGGDRKLKRRPTEDADVVPE